MARLLADENFELEVVLHLRPLGHDVVTTQEAGLAYRKTPDSAILAFATQDDRAVLTHNRRHFKKLHRQSPQHGGIIACTVDLDFAALALRIDEAIKLHEPLVTQLVLVYRP